jgi:hypothetical protein
MTRARTRLVLTHAARRRNGSAVVDRRPSPFLADIDPTLVEHRSGPLVERARRRPAGRQLRLL